MLLRITHPVSGSIDGIQLDHFEVDQLYEVGTAVGSYLLAVGAAVPVNEGDPTLGGQMRFTWQAAERSNSRRRPRSRR